MTDTESAIGCCAHGMWPTCRLPDLCPKATPKLIDWQLRNQRPAPPQPEEGEQPWPPLCGR